MLLISNCQILFAAGQLSVKRQRYTIVNDDRIKLLTDLIIQTAHHIFIHQTALSLVVKFLRNCGSKHFSHLFPSHLSSHIPRWIKLALILWPFQFFPLLGIAFLAPILRTSLASRRTRLTDLALERRIVHDVYHIHLVVHCYSSRYLELQLFNTLKRLFLLVLDQLLIVKI